jgi:hypothetical protein
MGKRFYAGLSAALIVLLVIAVGSSVLALGGSKRSLKVATFPAAAFVPVTSSTNNNNGQSVCEAFVARQNMDPGLLNSENRGDLNAIKGSNLIGVNLPQGARLKTLTLFANDNDADTDAHLLMVRKRLKAGLTPQFNGYRVLARTKSNGAVLNTMRRFADASVAKPVINNRGFSYYLELVVCGTVEPFAAQVAFAP